MKKLLFSFIILGFVSSISLHAPVLAQASSLSATSSMQASADVGTAKNILRAVAADVLALKGKTSDERTIEKTISPRILPGNPLYVFKSGYRNIRLFLTRNPEKRADRALAMAQEKLIEAHALLEKGKDEKAARHLADSRADMETAARGGRANFKDVVAAQVLRAAYFSSIRDALSDAVKDEVEAAQRASVDALSSFLSSQNEGTLTKAFTDAFERAKEIGKREMAVAVEEAKQKAISSHPEEREAILARVDSSLREAKKTPSPERPAEEQSQPPAPGESSPSAIQMVGFRFDRRSAEEQGMMEFAIVIPASPIRSFQFDLQYEDAVIRLLGQEIVPPGVSLDARFGPNVLSVLRPGPGRVRIAVANAEGVPIHPSGDWAELLRIRFDIVMGVQRGAMNLITLNSIAENAEGMAIPLDINDVSISPPISAPPPAPASDNDGGAGGQTPAPASAPSCTEDRYECGEWSACGADSTQTRRCDLAFDCPGIATPSKPAVTRACTRACSEDVWSCDGWSACSAYGKQTRMCVLSFDCPSTASPPRPEQTRACTPNCTADTWSCSEWNTCQPEGYQTRACAMTVDCDSATTPSPATRQSCTPSCTEDMWSCGEWSACGANGAQTRVCSRVSDCVLADTPKPAESQSCTPPPVYPSAALLYATPTGLSPGRVDIAPGGTITVENTDSLYTHKVRFSFGAQADVIPGERKAVIAPLEKNLYNIYLDGSGSPGALVVVN